MGARAGEGGASRGSRLHRALVTPPPAPGLLLKKTLHHLRCLHAVCFRTIGGY